MRKEQLSKLIMTLTYLSILAMAVTAPFDLRIGMVLFSLTIGFWDLTAICMVWE